MSTESHILRKNVVKPQELQKNYVKRGVFLGKSVKHEVC